MKKSIIASMIVVSSLALAACGEKAKEESTTGEAAASGVIDAANGAMGAAANMTSEGASMAGNAVSAGAEKVGGAVAAGTEAVKDAGGSAVDAAAEKAKEVGTEAVKAGAEKAKEMAQ